MVLHEHVLTCLLLVLSAPGVFGQTIGDANASEGKDPNSAGGVASTPASYIRPVVVAPVKPREPWLKPGGASTVNWAGLMRDSLVFSTLQHSFRLATEPGTREGMKGPFFPGWAHAAGNLHGWSDGDPFYVNYVGHPMQGSVAGFIWAQNDRRYLGVEFGANPEYWRSRLRATAFSFAYSAMFEIGPYSEASIGKVQSVWPQQGLVDHVITPAVGFGWMIAEDALDHLVIKRFEEHVQNPVLRVLVRGTLNPTRSWANMMRFKVPWARDSRPGAFSPLLTSYLKEQRGGTMSPAALAPKELQGEFGIAGFEGSTYIRPVFFQSSRTAPCLGGGAEGALRIVDQLQWVVDVSGCNLLGLEKDRSGDTLTYVTGPRWRFRPDGRWSPYAQFLMGGMKITQEQLHPELRETLALAARQKGSQAAVPKPEYTSTTDSNSLALSVGGGVDVRLHPAFALRLASLEYRKSWNPPMNGRQYNDGLSFSIAMVLRMGTW